MVRLSQGERSSPSLLPFMRRLCVFTAEGPEGCIGFGSDGSSGSGGPITYQRVGNAARRSTIRPPRLAAQSVKGAN